MANGLPPVADSIHENYTFSDGRGEIKGREWILSGEAKEIRGTCLLSQVCRIDSTFEGRVCAGTVELFAEGASFGFKMTQTINFTNFKLANGVDVSGKTAENVVTFGVVTCGEGKILSHQQRGDDINNRKF